MFEFEENVPARCLWTRPQEVSEIVFFTNFLDRKLGKRERRK
jgi:hypothetical protein